MDHSLDFIPYDPYRMVNTVWPIPYGLYRMVHTPMILKEKKSASYLYQIESQFLQLDNSHRKISGYLLWIIV